MEKIEIDWEGYCIRCGTLFSIRYYVPNINYPWVAKNICGISVKNYKRKGNPCGTKEKNKKITEMLGISPTKYAKMLKGAQYSLWIKGKEDLIKEYGVTNRRRNPVLISLITRHIATIRKYQKDGLHHLVPLAICFGKSTEELKNSFGKGLWKSLCRNSKSRNKSLMIICIRHRISFTCSDMIRQLNSLSSTTLNKSLNRIASYNIIDLYSVCWADTQCKLNGSLYKGSRYLSFLHIVMDTMQMAKELDKKVSFNWSAKKMREKHDEFSAEILAKKYSKELIVFPFYVERKIRRGDMEAVLLDSPYALYEQGKKEGHCVASYLNRVKNGEYLVYDIRENGITKSTLGLNVVLNNLVYEIHSVSKDQHYAKYNQQPEEHISDFADVVFSIVKETISKRLIAA